MKSFGQSPALEPLKNLSISREQIDRLRRSLDTKARDLLLFDLATQTGMRLKDLLRLKVGDAGPYHKKIHGHGWERTG